VRDGTGLHQRRLRRVHRHFAVHFAEHLHRWSVWTLPVERGVHRRSGLHLGRMPSVHDGSTMPDQRRCVCGRRLPTLPPQRAVPGGRPLFGRHLRLPLGPFRSEGGLRPAPSGRRRPALERWSSWPERPEAAASGRARPKP
jgi:hypothetical protein